MQLGLTWFRANLSDSTMYFLYLQNSASFSWCILFFIANKISLSVKLFKVAGKYLDLASTNIRQPHDAHTIGVQPARSEATAASSFSLDLSHECRTIAVRTTCDSLAFVARQPQEYYKTYDNCKISHNSCAAALRQT